MSEQERFEREANREVEGHVNRQNDEPTEDDRDRVRETEEGDEVEAHRVRPRNGR